MLEMCEIKSRTGERPVKVSTACDELKEKLKCKADIQDTSSASSASGSPSDRKIAMLRRLEFRLGRPATGGRGQTSGLAAAGGARRNWASDRLDAG